MPSEKRVPNRLVHEKSPYLLQHAYNPVDWHPWNDEAFERARREDKPVFLSIGYSTCHWCHVMERESFEDEQIADLLNRDFVSVKVDREERPDVDSVYMAVCQALTGAGGWPLTIVMTPDQKPFFAATYLPKTARYHVIGLAELLPEIARQWKSDRGNLLRAAEEIPAFLQRAEAKPASAPVGELPARGVRQLREGFDPVSGGFFGAPKFPTPHSLLFLLRFSSLEGDQSALQMAETTLQQMYRGGIFDHVGGGFSRYSTDERWLVPHFEKMLYDNALLSYVYLEAFRITRRPLYRTVAERTLEYVLRELKTEAGGFACGQDADSDGVEGGYYTFSPEKIAEVLGSERGQEFCDWFGVTRRGHLEGKSVLNLLSNDRFEESLEPMRPSLQALYDYRLRRISLHRDDKILTAWNALMLAALAKAARVLENPRYLQDAERTRQFIEQRLSAPDGRLFVRWRDGEAAFSGQLDDYAFYAWALLELYRCTFDAGCLDRAAKLADQMISRFFDRENGGFYIYASDAKPLILRPKDTYDGAMPSGNAVAALVLGQLSRLTAEPQWQQRSDLQLTFLAAKAESSPASHTCTLTAVLEDASLPQQLLCAVGTGRIPPTLHPLLEESDACNLTAVVKTPQNQDLLASVAPFTGEYPLPEQGEAYYLCRGGGCLPPVYDTDALRRLLRA